MQTCFYQKCIFSRLNSPELGRFYSWIGMNLLLLVAQAERAFFYVHFCRLILLYACTSPKHLRISPCTLRVISSFDKQLHTETLPCHNHYFFIRITSFKEWNFAQSKVVTFLSIASERIRKLQTTPTKVLCQNVRVPTTFKHCNIVVGKRGIWCISVLFRWFRPNIPAEAEENQEEKKWNVLKKHCLWTTAKLKPSRRLTIKKNR